MGPSNFLSWLGSGRLWLCIPQAKAKAVGEGLAWLWLVLYFSLHRVHIKTLNQLEFLAHHLTDSQYLQQFVQVKSLRVNLVFFLGPAWKSKNLVQVFTQDPPVLSFSLKNRDIPRILFNHRQEADLKVKAQDGDGEFYFSLSDDGTRNSAGYVRSEIDEMLQSQARFK
ncbi:hypothetical protein B0H19DRAFT_1071339 [Mycena capillaripes]|nr:hypothetical protein B0H19DRAFT_1071339 [Mycena capillaripes]